jgi:hypothetical protein
MSEHITHIAVFEDSISLIQLSGFHDAFKLAIEQQPDSGFFGSATRGNHLHAMPILDKIKKQWPRHDQDDLKQLSCALGWIAHRAADLTVKPLFDQAAEDPTNDFPEHEHEMYHDAFTLKYVYDNGKRASASPLVKLSAATLQQGMHSHPGAKLIDVPVTENAITGMLYGELLTLHKFSSETSSSDMDSWLNTFFNRRQRLYEDLRMYIQAYENPDPAKVKYWITDANYYHADDAIISLIRDFQKNSKTSTMQQLEQAVGKSANESVYARALSRSYSFLKTCDQFFKNEIAASEAYDALEIFPENHRIVN